MPNLHAFVSVAETNSYPAQRPVAVGRAEQVVSLRPTTSRAWLHFGIALGVTLAGVALAAQGSWWTWALGQLLLAAAFVQWFVLLHEAGHGTLFCSARANALAGHCAALFTGIPFASWRLIHGLHHKWTGWQDKDPTTAALVPRRLSRFERWMVNGAWRTGFPLFTLLYRTRNFWNLPRLLRLAKRQADRRAVLLHSALLLAVYVALLMTVGLVSLLKLVGVGLLLSFVMLDPLMLSQHTHIPMPVSDGEVRPVKASEQQRFTRTLRFPEAASKWWLLGFDAHEAHHVFPQVPGYLLYRVRMETLNEFPLWSWLKRAKQLSGEEFLFSNRDGSGHHI